MLAACFIGIGVLVAIVSWFQMGLEERERQERLELEGLAKGHTGALFETKDAELFPVRRSREQFERFFVPGFTIVLAIVQLTAAYLLWRWLNVNAVAVELKQPTTSLSIFALLGLILFLL